MLKIGLTGGIGSGKTTIARIFELLGVPVYNADAASKRLYHSDPGVVSAMKKHFGEDIYRNGQLDRERLAREVFSDPSRLALLNSLVHPPTIRDAEKWMQSQQADYIIKEAALIFESGSSAGLDYVIGVYSPAALRIKRVMKRDGVTEKTVTERMKRQIDEEVKMKLCDFIIRNEEKEAVIPQVLALHNRLTAMAMATR